MTRAALATLALFALAACAPRTVDTPGLTATTGRLCGLDRADGLILLDGEAIATAEVGYPGTREWCIAHETAHLRLDGSGINLGPGLVGLERLAQCGAELELGHGPPYTVDALGYWSCPDWALELTRQADG
jgi:hypothetical protein